MKEILIGDNETGKRLDVLLRQSLPHAGSGFLYKMLRKKNITLNGHKADGTERLAKGDLVRIFFSDDTLNKFSGTKMSTSDLDDTGPENVNAGYFINCYEIIENKGKIGIVYEDEDVIVINKPSGLLSQKSTPESISVNEWLIGYLLTKGIITPDQLFTYRPSVVNRLDRNTSGLLLCACNLKAARALSKAVKERRVGKFYRCIVYGKYIGRAVLRGYMLKDNDNFVNVFEEDENVPENAKYMESKVTFLKYNNTHDVSLLEIELVTGRSHQIRVSLFCEGFPIVGDRKYFRPENDSVLLKEFNISNQLLHAYRLDFTCFHDDDLPGISGRILTAEDMFPPLL